MKYILWSAAVTFLIGLFAVLFMKSLPPGTVPDRDSHQATYLLTDFYPKIQQDNYTDSISSTIYGGIVSHHLLASEDIAKFFAEFRSQPVKTIVLIGPNHFGVGSEPAAISRLAFRTPWGDVEPDSSVIEELIARKVVIADESPFRVEHSISALVPYIKYNFPEAHVVPIVLQRNITRLQLDDLTGALQDILKEDSIVVASVDFSHHLNEIATNFHDEASLSAIQNFDFERIFNLEIDSPPSIYVLLKYLAQKDAYQALLRSRNSADYTGSESSEDMTSYVFGHFIRGERETDSVATSLHFGDLVSSGEAKELLIKNSDPFRYIQGTEGNFLRGVDVTIGSLESVITSTSSCREEREVTVKLGSAISTLLRKYNFTGVTYTNDQTDTCYLSRFLETKVLLEEQGLFTLSPSKNGVDYVTKNIGSLKVTFVGLSEIGMDENGFDSYYTKITQLRNESDSLVVHMHWGNENNAEPSLVQKKIAHGLIDAGADVIIGHHPYVVPSIEKYKGKMIFYSLENPTSDLLTEENKVGFGVGLVHRGEGDISGSIFPYQVKDGASRLMAYDLMSTYCTEFLGDMQATTCSF